MNKIHEKKPNQLVFDYKYSDIGILPTMKELTQDDIYRSILEDHWLGISIHRKETNNGLVNRYCSCATSRKINY